MSGEHKNRGVFCVNFMPNYLLCSFNIGYYYQVVGDFQIVVLPRRLRQYENMRYTWLLLSLLHPETVYILHWKLLTP